MQNGRQVKQITKIPLDYPFLKCDVITETIEVIIN